MTEQPSAADRQEIEAAVAEAVCASESLINLLQREKELVEAGSYLQVDALKDEKEALTRSLVRRTPLLQAVGGKAVLASRGGDRLIRNMRLLAEAAKADMTALQGAIRAADRIMGTMREAASAGSPKNYGRGGKIDVASLGAIAVNSKI